MILYDTSKCSKICPVYFATKEWGLKDCRGKDMLKFLYLKMPFSNKTIYFPIFIGSRNVLVKIDTLTMQKISELHAVGSLVKINSSTGIPSDFNLSFMIPNISGDAVTAFAFAFSLFIFTINETLQCR